MRHLTKLLLTAGLAVTFVSIVVAQRQGGGGGQQFTEPALLVNKSVQEELKLTDAQKEKVAKIQDKFTSDMKDAAKDKDARQKAIETRDTSANEVIKDLKPEQQKRLLQVFVQVNTNPPMAKGGFGGGFGGPNPLTVFTNETVQKTLKLDDKQKSMIKTIADDTQKDSAEILKNAGKDKDARKEAATKVATLNKEAVDKIVATFSDDQKKIWKDLPGEKFEYKSDFTPKKKDN
jgi:Spy/CpxP family protein refolding chaperone